MAQRRRRRNTNSSKANRLANLVSRLTGWSVKGAWFAVIIVILYFVGRYVVAQNSPQHDATTISEYGNLQQVSIPEGITNEVCIYKGFTAYFNADYRIPNCVIYELTADETIGKVPRAKNFVTDEKVMGCADPADYQYSGYDRGHMAPAGDMKWNRDAMRESFYMTNICPQVKALNTGAWNRLEGRVREWAKRDSALIVATGPILADDMPTIGGKAGIAVPPRFYKIVLAHHASPMRAIAFIYDNARAKGSAADHAVTVDEVERLTGIDFFSSLPDDIENEVESHADYLQWEQRKQ